VNSKKTSILRSARARLLLKFVLWVVLLCVAITYTIMWFKGLAAPSVRAGLLWSAVLVGLIVTVKVKGVRLALANLLAVLLALTAFEAYSEARSGEAHEAPPTYSLGYFSSERGDILGYGPKRGDVAHAHLERAGKLIYDVDYGIDEDGLRVAPPAMADPLGTVLFFGDSFGFGEGLTDKEAMPYQVGVVSSGRYRVYNFAFHGYGPHQMLSELEHSLVRDIVKPHGAVTAIYQAIPDHVRRVAGLAFFDTHGPRYLLDPAGVPRFAGHFDDGFEIFLRKLYLYRRFNDVHQQIDSRDIELYGAVVQRSGALCRSLFPGADFEVLYWDMPEDPHTPAIAHELERRGIRVHSMSEILPGYPEHKADFTIPLDGHPNARADRLIAEYVVHQILEPGTNAPHVVTNTAR